MKPQLYYFAIRGRGEPIRLALAALNIEWEECGVDYPLMKSDLQQFPFTQCPRFVDEDGNIAQSNTIMRHLGRKHGLYGDSLAEAARIDMLADGVEDIKRKYLSLIYQDQLLDEAKKAYWSAHIDPASATGGRNSGAHFAYLAKLMEQYGAEGWAVGGKMSIADVLVYELTDLHIRAFGSEFGSTYPLLEAHHAKLAAVPGIKAYLGSSRQFDKVNNNGLG
ncbi:hypothetical protein ABPG77_009708 [Micractinium sp. CCAP 211/92]